MTRSTVAMHGVNLGGWLILEKWLTPSVFRGMNAEDEWGLSQTAAGRKRIAAHRRAFFTEDDFRWLKDHDILFVRLPVPHWAIDGSNEYVSAKDEIAWAMKMAEKYEIKVLLDLHAAPGGQNTGDHSGRKGQMEWFSNKDYQDQTIEMLKTLARTYKDSPALWGIEIMNEPELRGHYWQLVRFYRRAYKELRGCLRPGTYTVFHDAFQPLLFAGSLRPRRNFPVSMDVHWYGFTIDRAKTFKTYLQLSSLLRRLLVYYAQLWQPVIVGEWSSVLPQRFFDERPQAEHMRLLRENSEMQYGIYAATAGSMYWNYKAEGEGMWNFRSLVEKGVISLE